MIIRFRVVWCFYVQCFHCDEYFPILLCWMVVVDIWKGFAGMRMLESAAEGSVVNREVSKIAQKSCKRACPLRMLLQILQLLNPFKRGVLLWGSLENAGSGIVADWYLLKRASKFPYVGTFRPFSWSTSFARESEWPRMVVTRSNGRHVTVTVMSRVKEKGYL